MNKLAAFGLSVAAILLIVIGGTVALYWENQSKVDKVKTNASSTTGSGRPNSSSHTSTPSVQTACGLLTKAAAQATLGASAKTSSSNGLADTESTDIKITQCTYIVEGATPEDHAEASLTLHLAKTALGAHTNQIAFGSDRPKGTTTVSGYGDTAFWDPAQGQLNILQHNNWYVVSILHDTSPAKTTLSEVEQLAKYILGQL